MSAKISNELLRSLQEAEEVPVIVTITAGTDLAELERKGLKIQQAYKNMPAVSGILPAARANEVAQLDQVENIELDQQAWALRRAKQ